MSDVENWTNPPTLDEYLEQLRVALKDEAEKNAERERLKNLTDVVFAEIVNHAEGNSVSSREYQALGHERYKTHLLVLHEATTEANLASAKVKWLETRFEAWRSRNANRREEMRLTR